MGAYDESSRCGDILVWQTVLRLSWVGSQITQNAGEADMAIESIQPAFGGVPVILMSQNEQGSPTYYGDQEIVALLADVPIDKMPWKEYTIS